MTRYLWIIALWLSASSWAAPPLLEQSFPDPKGKPQAIKQWQGKMLIVNYWATWCGPCRIEMPEMIALQKQYGKKVQFIGIAIDEPAPAAQFAQQIGVNYPILIGGNRAMDLMRSQGNNLGGLPFTVFFDAKGRQVAKHVGKISKAQMEAEIKKYAQ